MGRPKKCRWVEIEPGVTFFKPRGIPLRSLQQIVITVDELEAMRLADFLEMTQEEVAQTNASFPAYGDPDVVSGSSGGG